MSRNTRKLLSTARAKWSLIALFFLQKGPRKHGKAETNGIYFEHLRLTLTSVRWWGVKRKETLEQRRSAFDAVYTIAARLTWSVLRGSFFWYRDDRHCAPAHRYYLAGQINGFLLRFRWWTWPQTGSYDQKMKSLSEVVAFWRAFKIMSWEKCGQWTDERAIQLNSNDIHCNYICFTKLHITPWALRAFFLWQLFL